MIILKNKKLESLIIHFKFHDINGKSTINLVYMHVCVCVCVCTFLKEIHKKIFK